MKVLFIFVIFIVFIYLLNTKQNFNNSRVFPKIVHLIYTPWYRDTGILKEDENDFNHTFYEYFQKNNKDWDVKMWTLSKMKNFIHDNYPFYDQLWNIVSHPVQSVDFFRLIVTYHYGGIYWQYDSKQNTSLDNFIPGEGYDITLFLESIATKELCLAMAKEPIRNNKPEELIRVATQVFAAYPKNDFLRFCIDKSWNNLQRLKVIKYYDIWYIAGNAMFSEAYDEYKNKDKLFLVLNTKDYVSFSSNGSWILKNYNKI